jgi:hypothetical protein
VRVGSGLASTSTALPSFPSFPCASPHFAPVVGAYAIRAPAFCYHRRPGPGALRSRAVVLRPSAFANILCGRGLAAHPRASALLPFSPTPKPQALSRLTPSSLLPWHHHRPGPRPFAWHHDHQGRERTLCAKMQLLQAGAGFSRVARVSPAPPFTGRGAWGCPTEHGPGPC